MAPPEAERAAAGGAVRALVLAAVVHGELLALRPFADGNGPVARAVFRHLLTAGAVDPVGVLVPEVRWAAEPNVYLATAAGFMSGTAEGVAAGLRYCAESVVRAPRSGGRWRRRSRAGRSADLLAAHRPLRTTTAPREGRRRRQHG